MGRLRFHAELLVPARANLVLSERRARREGLVPIRLVAQTMTGMLTRYRNMFGPIIKEYRVRENKPRNLSETEYLYNELMKYLERHPELKS